MSDPQNINPPEPEAKSSEATGTAPKAEPPAAPAKPLTKEEQMALYEEHLKETDWGHQPC